MNRYLPGLLVAFLLVPQVVGAVELKSEGTTIVRFQERSTPGFDKQRVVPATQYIGLDLEKMGDGHLSFHLNGWGRVDLADQSTSEGTTDGDLTNAYLLYRFPIANGQVKAGRFFVREGVAADQVDGVSARVDLQKGFSISVFGGAPVRLDRGNDNKGDYIVGGRLGCRYPGLELGVSALREGGVSTGTSTNLKDYRQLVGGDIWLSPLHSIELRGHTFYNTATSGVAEHSYLLLVKPLASLSVAGEFNDYRFKDYFATANIRSLFNPDKGEKLRSYGISVTYTIAAPLSLVADYKRVNYDSTSHGNTNLYGAELRFNNADMSLRSGISYHRADASGGINSYHEVRGYGTYAIGKLVSSLDAIAHFYDDTIYSKDTAYEFIASLGYRILSELTLSGDISNGENPSYDHEVRGLMRLVYNFNYPDKGAIK